MGQTDTRKAAIQAESLIVLDVDLGGPVNLEATLTCGQAFRWRPAQFPGRSDLSIAYLGTIPVRPGRLSSSLSAGLLPTVTPAVARTDGDTAGVPSSPQRPAPSDDGQFAQRLANAPVSQPADVSRDDAGQYAYVDCPGNEESWRAETVPVQIGYSNGRGDERFRSRDQLAVTVGQVAAITCRISVAYDLSFVEDLSPNDVASSVIEYFSAEDDVAAIEETLSRQDPVIAAALRHSSGLRLLRQDYWECLASYVLSINNSIPRISYIVEWLANCLGDPVGFGLRGFPSPDKLACQETAFLRQSSCGFRDRHLKDAAERVLSSEVDLEDLNLMPTDQARERLMRIRGVGPKVADCVLLFGYHKLEVFPVDVWIARAMSHYYFGGRTITPKAAREEGASRFKQLAGYAQEYLFLNMRSHRDVLFRQELP